MIKKVKKYLNVRLALIFILVFAITSNITIVTAESDSKQIYNEVMMELQTKTIIDNKNLSIEERYKNLNIEKNKLNYINTDSLINIVLEYPLLGNIFAYDNTIEGLSVLLQKFDPINELIFRENALKSIGQKLSDIEIKNDFIKSSFLKTLRDYISNNKYSPYTNTLEATQTTVKTPKGTSVTVYIYWEELSNSEKNSINSYFDSEYPNATRIGSATTNYNCHSYACYNTSTSNKYWMNNPNSYMTDGSYLKVSSSEAKKVFYPNSGSSHSGTYVSGTVTSKWGQAGLYKHSLVHCPYGTSGVTYYKFNSNIPTLLIDWGNSEIYKKITRTNY